MSPDALSTTTARMLRPGVARSPATERRASMVKLALLYETITTATSRMPAPLITPESDIRLSAPASSRGQQPQQQVADEVSRCGDTEEQGHPVELIPDDQEVLLS